MSSTRENWILGSVPGPGDEFIPHNRLPTVRDIYYCFLLKKQELSDIYKCGESVTRPAALHVFNIVEDIYKKAHIKILTESNVLSKIYVIHKEYTNLIKINSGCRDDTNISAKNKQKMINFRDSFDKTMILWPRGLLKQMEEKLKSLKGNTDNINNNQNVIDSLEEDIEFLKSMMQDRVATMGGVSTNVNRSLDRKEERKRTRTAPSPSTNNLVNNSSTIDIEQDNNDIDNVNEFTPPPTKRSHKRIKKVGTPLYVDYDILRHPELLAHAERLQMTPTATSSFVQKFVEVLGGDISRVSTSYSTADR